MFSANVLFLCGCAVKLKAIPLSRWVVGYIWLFSIIVSYYHAHTSCACLLAATSSVTGLSVLIPRFPFTAPSVVPSDDGLRYYVVVGAGGTRPRKLISHNVLWQTAHASRRAWVMVTYNDPVAWSVSAVWRSLSWHLAHIKLSMVFSLGSGRMLAVYVRPSLCVTCVRSLYEGLTFTVGLHLSDHGAL